MDIKQLIFIGLSLIATSICAQRDGDYHTLTVDGAWCWFSDPRAVYHKGNYEQSYIGFATSTGDIAIVSYDHQSGKTTEHVIYEELQVDDHINPSILLLPDGRLMVFFTRHNGTMYHTTSTRPEDISEFEPVQMMDLGRMLCYTNPVLLTEESNRIYVFFRGGYDWKPTFITSDDLGKTWSKPVTLVSKKDADIHNRPYTKVISDGRSNIHFAFTDGHPREENHNSIYYLRYEKGKFYDAGGQVMGDLETLPIDQDLIPKAYDGKVNNQRAWIWDIALDENNRPVIAYSTLPEETKHSYNYGFWDGKAWQNSHVCMAGSAFPRFNRLKEDRYPEPHYSGGIVLDGQNTNVAYVSRPIGDRFEIEKYTTNDGGKTFTSVSITSQSLKDNVRPYVIRDAPESVTPRLCWMNIEHYEHYDNFKTAIKTAKPGEKYSADITVEAITEVMKAVADWQIDNFHLVTHHPLDWTNGALYLGIMEWAKIAPDRKYFNWLKDIGHAHGWQPHKRMYHADDIVVSQMYLEMYEQQKGNKYSYRILQPTKSRLDFVVSNPSKGNLLLDYGDPQTMERWSWCDALFMAPPVYTKLAAITGDDNYLEFMDREFKATYDLLYDREEHLFYRDHRYFPELRLESNGEKVFWARGNGWVMGGLVSILKNLPEDSDYRTFYTELFVEMAQKVATCQDQEGFWHASMLDPNAFPNPETSSTAFFTYALAYGINEELISREAYWPVVKKAWQALTSAIYADGKLGWVQPIGQDPKHVTAEMTEVYGVGAFLLAGTQIIKLVP